jgi:hypothetical protein
MRDLFHRNSGVKSVIDILGSSRSLARNSVSGRSHRATTNV